MDTVWALLQTEVGRFRLFNKCFEILKQPVTYVHKDTLDMLKNKTQATLLVTLPLR